MMSNMSNNTEEKEEEFENVINGFERANMKFYQFSLLVFYPEGFWKYYNRIVLCLFVIVLVYFLITGVITIYLQIHDIFVVFEVANIVLILLAVIINLADFHFVRKKRLLWYKLLGYCKDDFSNYICKSVENEIARLRSVCGIAMKWFFIIAAPSLVMTILLMFVFIPVFRYILNEEQKTDDTAFNVFLPLPFWSIFNTRTIMGFTLQYLILLFMVFNAQTILLVYIGTVFYFFLELMTQLKILCFALTKHDERIEVCKNGAKRMDQSALSLIGGERIDEVIITEILKEPIIHHLKIMEFYKMFQEFSSFFFCLVLSGSMLMIVALAVILIKMDSLLTLEGFKFISILFCEILNIFSLTYCGSMLVEESYKVKKCLYSIHWYGYNSNQKKTINIFQIQSASELLLTASGIYSIDLNTFLQVMQTAYSVFNVLNAKT